MASTFIRRAAAPAWIALVALVCLPAPATAAPRGYARVEPVCPAPAPGEATCLALARVPVPVREAGQPGVRPLAALPAVGAGPAKGFTPAQLASAYGFDPANEGGEGQTVAVVDAYDDPNIEADLAKFSEQYELPACTSKNGCFTKVGQTGSALALPEPDPETGWSVEISLDVETVHAACQKCRILLVESNDEKLGNLAAAVKKAAEMGATEISNSYSAHEGGPPGPLLAAAYDKPGIVIAAATGDAGYDGWEFLPSPEVPDFPASMPGVVSVGGTSLVLGSKDERLSERVWNGHAGGASGGGCSVLFAAQLWQRYVPGFAATGCGDKRLSADVAAVADPATGFDIYDSFNCGEACEELKGATPWSTIGGTSLSTPLISAMYALAGGAHGIRYPALTLYSHFGEPSSLFDVTQGGNGYCDSEGRACGANALFGETVDCEGTTSCNAAPGYDGPSGVGAPASLEAFEPVPEEEQAAIRRAEEVIAAEEAAKRAAEEAAKRAAEAAAKPPQPAGGQGAAGFKAVKAALPAATLRGASLRAGRLGWVTVRIGCPAGETRCEGIVRLRTLSAVIAGTQAHASVLTLASGRFKVAGGRVTAVRLHLSARARTLLARRGRLRVRVLILAHDPAGASHSSHTAATLRAFRRR